MTAISCKLKFIKCAAKRPRKAIDQRGKEICFVWATYSHLRYSTYLSLRIFGTVLLISWSTTHDLLKSCTKLDKCAYTVQEQISRTSSDAFLEVRRKIPFYDILCFLVFVFWAFESNSVPNEPFLVCQFASPEMFCVRRVEMKQNVVLLPRISLERIVSSHAVTCHRPSTTRHPRRSVLYVPLYFMTHPVYWMTAMRTTECKLYSEPA